ncbi:Mitochondrial carnitine/acylcarnitine carrier-like protein [Nymphaea thermarum]|nr:Mitochondrial carnitine/acylcarnitine carrier-like protein [Nymphaea thermarum]
MARQVAGNTFLLWMCESSKQSLADNDTSKLGQRSQMLAGASFWLAVYSEDVIKSSIRVDYYKNQLLGGVVI